MAINAIIFDLDGTLVDSMEIVHETLNLILRDLGLRGVSREEMAEIAGMRLSDILAMRAPWLDHRAAEEGEERFKAIYSTSQLRLIPGAKEAMEWLRSQGIRMGLVTTTPKGPALEVIERLGIADYFSIVVAVEDVERPKPHPDGPLKASRSLGVDPRYCAFVGDSPNDIKAGKAAGTRTIGVLTGFSSSERLAREGADLILRSVGELPSALLGWDP
ncbi:MAG: HAD family hydrolase [Candidatus Bathyarchaeia archaeon]